MSLSGRYRVREEPQRASFGAIAGDVRVRDLRRVDADVPHLLDPVLDLDVNRVAVRHVDDGPLEWRRTRGRRSGESNEERNGDDKDQRMAHGSTLAGARASVNVES